MADPLMEALTVTFGPIGLIIGLGVLWRNAARRHRSARAFFLSLICVIPTPFINMFQATVDAGTPEYWGYQLASESCLIAAMVGIGIFWCQLTGPSARNGWMFLLGLCSAADLAVIGCQLVYPGAAAIFAEIYNLSSILYFLGYLGVTAGVGFPVFVHTYRYTRERRALAFTLALLVTTVGHLLGLIYYAILATGIPVPAWYSALRPITATISMLGLLIFWFMMLPNVDYIYRLPFDVHLLVVCYRTSGLPAYTANFKTQQPLKIEPNLLAGLFTALNSVFMEVGRKEVALESVAGPGMHFLLEWGTGVATLVVSDRDTHYLRQAVKGFTRDFEARYAADIKAQTPQVNVYDQASEIIKRNFPFLLILGQGL